MSGSQVTVIATVKITYDLNGMGVSDIKDILDDNIRRSVGNGMLTGDTAAEVDEWSVTIQKSD